MRYREASTGEIKPRAGQEEAMLYIGHGEYTACHLLRVGSMKYCEYMTMNADRELGLAHCSKIVDE